MSDKQIKGLHISEEEFQNRTIELAQRFGWRVAHFRAAKTEHGWRTPVSADGSGFPDVVAVKGNKILFIEFKSNRGCHTESQKEWIARLGQAARSEKCEVYVATWRPRDDDGIVKFLTADR